MKKMLTAARLRGFDAPTVWAEFTPLSVKHGSCNLGQGFPDWESPMFVKEAMGRAVMSNFNQYCRSEGDVKLVETLAKQYSPLVGRTINPMTEVTVTVGATEALFATMQAMLNEGDEVVVLEPTFDIYPAQIQMAGGITRHVPLRLQNDAWQLDMAELEAAITPKTKLMILNTPHNPTGKVLTMEELGSIRSILLRHPHVTAVMDEVYEKLVYAPHVHCRLASLPDMWDRTLTVSSAGKTFSTTGWKVGWVYGAAHLVKPLMLANQWVQFCVSTPAQRAMAEVLETSDRPYEGHPTYYHYVNSLYERKMRGLVESLRAGNFNPIVPEAGFFVIADTSRHTVPPSFFEEPAPNGETPVSRDWAFARWLTVVGGITPIPPSAFYTPERRGLAANLARFAFCKRDETLAEAHKRFVALGTATNSDGNPDATSSPAK